MKWAFQILLFLLAIKGQAQGTNMVYEKIDISPSNKSFLHSDIDRIPGKNEYLVSATKSFPFYHIDGDSHELLAEHDIGNWFAGSRIELSPTGKYILLQQLHYIDFSPNKDREVTFAVVDTKTGKTLLKIPSAHDAAFHPHEENLIVLIGDDVYSYAIAKDEKRKLFPVPAATNCIAISPDGKHIAITHYPSDEFLHDFVTKKRQKKNFKVYKKYRQCISVYDAETYDFMYTVADMYDIPYLLDFDPMGEHILCYSVPHTKVMAKTGMNGTKYFSKIKASDGSSTSVGFVSNSIYEPDFEFSNHGKWIALVTINRVYPEVWICNYESGAILARFEMATRISEGMKDREYPADAGRVGLAFSPDDKHLMITNGSILIKWEIPLTHD